MLRSRQALEEAPRFHQLVENPVDVLDCVHGSVIRIFRVRVAIAFVAGDIVHDLVKVLFRVLEPANELGIESQDRGSVEVFFNDGEQAFAALVYPLGEEGGITLEAVGGDADIRRMEVHRLRPITWEKGDLQRKPVE